MKYIHKAGDFVTYRHNGICKITDIQTLSFGGTDKRDYYRLSPIYDEKTEIFVPTDSVELVVQMRHVLNREEIDEIIESTDSENGVEWVDNTKERSKIYGEIIEGGDRTKILCIIKILSLYEKELEGTKKRLYATDKALLNQAQKIITEEFAFVLGINWEEVIPYILQKKGL